MVELRTTSSIRSKGRWGPVFREISTLAVKERTTKSSSLFSKDGKALEAAEALQRFAGADRAWKEVPLTLFLAYVDFCKMFDSVHGGTFWELLRLRGIPGKILALVRALYTETESAVRYGGGTSEFFPVPTRVRQGYVFAPSLFSVYMDWIMGRTVSSSSSGAAFGDERFTDFYFDDAVIFVETMEVSSLDVLSKESESRGLWVSWVKTKIQNFIQTVDQVSSVMCCGEEGDVVDVFP